MRWDPLRLLTVAAALALFACTGLIEDGGRPDPAAPDADVTRPADAALGGDDSDAGLVDNTPDASLGPLFSQLSPAEQDLFTTINLERAALGLQTVVLRENLVCAVRRHSDDIGPIQSCTHTGSDGSSPGDRVSSCGGSGGWSGEIVACGQGSPRSAVDAWLGSPGHNAIMLDPGQRFIGVAMNNNFWTAIFDR